ncbi:MAG: hypothetical protein IEMM0002_0864 [bacterium]|nr:MAG: hypothetical protein IEMM0002_0864 [bacterium]
MKLELESKDAENIARKVVEMIKTSLKSARETKTTPEERVFDVREVAEYLRIPASRIYQFVKDNEIPCFRVGKYVRFKKSAIDRWADKKMIAPSPLRVLNRKP